MAPLIGEAIHRFNVEERLRGLHEALARRATQLQTLASELTLAEHRERRRLAQLLHDHLQQLLYAARLSLSTLRRRTRDAETQGIVHQVDELLGQCIAESRSLTVELSPPILYDGGLAAALDWLARQMQQTYGLTVDVQADSAAEPGAEDIRVLLFQSVRELLFNVVKHAGVRRAKVQMTASRGREVQIVVADEGAGFDPAKLHIGEGSATGFGLFGVRERLELFGGRLEVHAAPGRGTHVKICAPRHAQGQPAEEPMVSEQVPAGGLPASAPAQQLADGAVKIRVLLADDHAIFRRGLVDLLQQEPDIDVVAQAGDGETAVDLALRIRPDVVLMDVAMPRLDGVAATQHITAALPGVRVIALSAHEADDMAELMCKAGALAYVSKGGAPEALLAAVRGSPASPSGD